MQLSTERVQNTKALGAGGGGGAQNNSEPFANFVMKILVQNPLTLSYYLQPGKWTHDPALAFAFSTSQEAVRHCMENGLHNLQIVFKFPDDRYDIELPILATQAGRLPGYYQPAHVTLSA